MDFSIKKELLFSIGLAFVACNALAVNFAPAPMRLSAPVNVRYDFYGKELSLPVTVSGVGGTGIFSVYTRDKGASIGKVQNGYLGWHYVNGIDTSIYISSPFELAVGLNNIRWNGCDESGNTVPPGDYTYYLWAYDSHNPKKYVSQKIGTTLHNEGRQVVITEYGSDGKPLANPFIYLSLANTSYKAKWTIGNDPADSALVETCLLIVPANYSVTRSIIPVPDDFSKVFAAGGLSRTMGKSIGVWKIKWVPNGKGEMDTAWAKNGYAGWDKSFSQGAGPSSDGRYLYRMNCQLHDTTHPDAGIGVFDLDDGALLRVFDITSWWSDPGDAAAGGLLNGGPNGMSMRNGNLILGSHGSCVVQLVNPLAENDADFVVWTNQNGDTILDHHFDPNSSMKWVCNSHGNSLTPLGTSFETDANLFTAGTVYGLGTISFGLLGPDGAGIGLFSFAGDTDSRKFYANFVDSNSSFDGIYSDNQASVSLQDNPNGAKFLVPGIMYTAHDSHKGVISHAPAVNEDVPPVFTVAQNTPNPFNPGTTISFTLCKAARTTVEVFNAAGQKMDTLLNANLSAGAHSVTWNASRLSAGVYFYTVRSDNFTKTMKMNHLK